MEWNGGVDYWSGVLDWNTGVPRPQIHSTQYTVNVYTRHTSRKPHVHPYPKIERCGLQDIRSRVEKHNAYYSVVCMRTIL